MSLSLLSRGNILSGALCVCVSCIARRSQSEVCVNQTFQTIVTLTSSFDVESNNLSSTYCSGVVSGKQKITET